MIWQSALAVYRKELTEVFRDRRTLISMIVIPVFVFPLLFSVTTKFMNARSREAGDEAKLIAIDASLPVELAQALKNAGFEVVTKTELRAAVQTKQAAAGLESSKAASGQRLTIYTDETRQASQIAGERIKSALNDVETGMLTRRLESAGLPATLAHPFEIQTVNVASQRKMAGLIVGSLVGYLIILLMFTAAMYPAIDMAAGEKERRTLEALLSSGASRDGIMLGKIFAAATASLLTGILTLGSLLFTLRNLMSPDLAGQLAQANLMEPSTIALVILTMVPISLLAASAMLAISLFAKSYKEGQTYVTPLLMLVIFPAVLGMLPGLELTPTLAFIPIFNVSQLVKEIFLGSFSGAAFWTTFGANMVYALAAFLIAGATFRRESVLFRT